MTSIRDRTDLINDKALESLRDEMRLQDALDRRGWTSIHSHYFYDLRTKEWRELDAVAVRTWVGQLAGRTVRIKVVILVESKSLSEKHFLLPQYSLSKQAIVFDWLGATPRRSERFRIYEDAGLARRIASVIDSEITGRSACVMPDAPNILLPPRDSVWHASGVKEARNAAGSGNKYKEEIGSSVVWKARLALQSAAQALAQDQADLDGKNLRLALQLVKLRLMAQEDKEKFNMKEEVSKEAGKFPFTITIFHPVIVADGDIWGVSENDVVPVAHGRVHLAGVSRYPYFWFDLVRREAADDVVSRAQKSYDDQAIERGLSGQDINLGVAEYTVAYP